MSMEIIKKKSSLQPTGCWKWEGRITPDGYGQFELDGTTLYAHRAAWSWENCKKIPKGMCICHVCDNRACVNPAHLFIGFISDNIKDAATKGRMIRGNKHHASKLTEADVRAIRGKLTLGVSQRVLGKEYGVSQNVIACINTKKIWGWLV